MSSSNSRSGAIHLFRVASSIMSTCVPSFLLAMSLSRLSRCKKCGACSGRYNNGEPLFLLLMVSYYLSQTSVFAFLAAPLSNFQECSLYCRFSRQLLPTVQHIHEIAIFFDGNIAIAAIQQSIL
ncbi:hypothetical protein CRM22_001767 [Opisthorchis felineus]|uniref:Uncharacterized protein n=1 Tax=Opisthorchis felineus TaxID=147828 RepID=A0A4S2M9A4_OPIFE|nr:hypothetical protein CRM22_001767 [Opisthorchis felineus]